MTYGCHCEKKYRLARLLLSKIARSRSLSEEWRLDWFGEFPSDLFSDFDW